jgi:hypothetical protein
MMRIARRLLAVSIALAALPADQRRDTAGLRLRA